MPVIHASHPCQSSMPVIHASHPCQSSMPVIHASYPRQSSMPVVTPPCQSSMPIMTPYPSMIVHEKKTIPNQISSLYLQLSITAISLNNAKLLSCHFWNIATVSHFRLVSAGKIIISVIKF